MWIGQGGRVRNLLFRQLLVEQVHVDRPGWPALNLLFRQLLVRQIHVDWLGWPGPESPRQTTAGKAA